MKTLILTAAAFAVLLVLSVVWAAEELNRKRRAKRAGIDWEG